MKLPIVLRIRSAAFGALFVPLFAAAQTTEGSNSRTAGATPGGRNDSTIELSPFEVKADSDKSYGALNSNSITAFNVALDHVPVTADIFDQAFMKDVGAINVEAAIQSYDAG